MDYSISSSGFSFTSMDRSDGSEDVIVVTEEGVKEVEKPHTEVSPAHLYVGIYVHRIKSIFPLGMTIMVNFKCCVRKS